MSDPHGRGERYSDGKTHQSVELKLPKLLLAALDVTSTFGEDPQISLVLVAPPEASELEELRGYLEEGTRIEWRLDGAKPR